MHWIDAVVLLNVATVAVIVALLVASFRGAYSEIYRIAFPGILIFQMGWSITDTLSAILAIHFNYVSKELGIAAGLCVLGIALSTFLFCEFFASTTTWHLLRKGRVAIATIGTLVCGSLTFSENFIAARRVEHGVRHGDYGPYFIVAGAWVVCLILFGLIMLMIRSFSTTDPRTRIQVRMFVLGSALNLGLAFLFSYILPLLGIYALDFAGPPSSVVFVSAVIYTILFHRFANLREAYGQLGVHLTLVCIGGIFLTLATAGIFRGSNEELPLAVVVTACLIFGIGIAYQRIVVPTVSRLIVEPALDVTHTLVEIFAASRAGLTRDSALSAWLEDVTIRFRIKGASLILTTKEGPLQLTTPDSETGSMKQLIGRFLGRRMPRSLLDELDTVFSTEDAASPFNFRFQRRYATLTGVSKRFLAESARSGYSVVVPLFRFSSLDAILFLGSRLSGDLYYEKDLQMLSSLRYALASAVQRVVEQADLSDSKARAENVASRLSQFLFQTRRIDIDPERQLVYRSEQMSGVVEKARLFAGQPRSVLILGETGTGKELIARMIHMEGQNRDRPFVAINCAALPPHLWEDEMFGHVRGAFTDARENRQGKLLEAADGTLFLDEVGELPLIMQAKLLRVLQERTFSPLGSDKSRNVKCRFLFATNRDLTSMINSKEFRPDLFYRISVLEISIPPLRDRLSDVPVIAAHLLDDLSRQEGIVGRSLSADALQHLINYDWPGNIRELQNVIVRAATTTTTAQITSGDLILPGSRNRQVPRSAGNAAIDYRTAVDQFRRDLLTRALSQVGGNKTRAAEALGIKRTTLNSQIKELGLS